MLSATYSINQCGVQHTLGTSNFLFLLSWMKISIVRTSSPRRCRSVCLLNSLIPDSVALRVSTYSCPQTLGHWFELLWASTWASAMGTYKLHIKVRAGKYLSEIFVQIERSLRENLRQILSSTDRANEVNKEFVICFFGWFSFPFLTRFSSSNVALYLTSWLARLALISASAFIQLGLNKSRSVLAHLIILNILQ